MRLFNSLCKRFKFPNGNIWIGKHRIVKQVTLEHLAKLRTQFEIEEKNMFYLRHAYLTPEQSKGHAKALGIPQARLLKVLTTKKDFKKDVTVETRLGHLRHQEAWD